MQGEWHGKPENQKFMMAYRSSLARVMVAAGLLALLAAKPASAGNTMSSEELRKLFPGQFAAVVRGYHVRFIAHGDGKLVGRYGGFSDKGRWSLRNGRLCITLKEWLNGKTTCAAVRRAGSWYQARDIRFRRM